MEPSSPPSRKGRSTVLFAIVAIALLLVGIGAGYVLGRPATPAPLGPVNSLARASAIPRVDGDRKSTRLNSSHPSISYAVFCLKKKTQRLTECIAIKTRHCTPHELN